jgi:hypothetical protein
MFSLILGAGDSLGGCRLLSCLVSGPEFDGPYSMGMSYNRRLVLLIFSLRTRIGLHIMRAFLDRSSGLGDIGHLLSLALQV